MGPTCHLQPPAKDEERDFRHQPNRASSGRRRSEQRVKLGSSTAAAQGLGRRRRPCSEPGSGGGAGVRPQTRGNNLRLAGVDPIRTPHFQIESQFSKSISWSMHWHAHPIKFHANESLSHLFLRSLQYASPSACMAAFIAAPPHTLSAHPNHPRVGHGARVASRLAGRTSGRRSF